MTFCRCAVGVLIPGALFLDSFDVICRLVHPGAGQRARTLRLGVAGGVVLVAYLWALWRLCSVGYSCMSLSELPLVPTAR